MARRKSKKWAVLRNTPKKRFYGKDYYLCHYCRVYVGINILTIDHMELLARGGTNANDNLVVSCKKCNQAKKDMEYEQYFKLIATS